jgi:hypothetical protein
MRLPISPLRLEVMVAPSRSEEVRVEPFGRLRTAVIAAEAVPVDSARIWRMGGSTRAVTATSSRSRIVPRLNE